MDISNAADSFAALAQETRLKVFRLLVRYAPDGLPAGEVARRLDVPHNTMSTHLSVLERTGWASSRRHGRSIVYRAELGRVREVVEFLVHDCCGGHEDACPPSIEIPRA